MKPLLTLSLLAALLLPSCSVIQNVRADITTMSQSEYDAMSAKVFALTAIASHRISIEFDDDKRVQALKITKEARALLQDADKLKTLGATDLVRVMIDRYSDEMDLKNKERAMIKNATLLIDLVVGPIKVGIDGKVNERELGLLNSMLDGLVRGLER